MSDMHIDTNFFLCKNLREFFLVVHDDEIKIKMHKVDCFRMFPVP